MLAKWYKDKQYKNKEKWYDYLDSGIYCRKIYIVFNFLIQLFIYFKDNLHRFQVRHSAIYIFQR